MKSNIFKSIYLFFQYRKCLLKNKEGLLLNFGAKIDYIFRIYTVLNIPKELIEEPYDFRTSDINLISQNYIKAYSNELEKYLNSIGLRELFFVYDVKKVDKFSYLLVFGFKLLNTKKLANNILYTSSILGFVGLIYLIIKIFG